MKAVVSCFFAILIVALALPASAVAKELSFSSESGNPGSEVTVSILSDYPAGIGEFEIYFTYDPEVLSFKGATRGSALYSFNYFSPTFVSPNELRLSAFGPELFGGPGELARVTFDILPGAYKDGRLSFTRTDLFNGAHYLIGGTTSINGSVVVTGVAVSVLILPAETVADCWSGLWLNALVIANGGQVWLTDPSSIVFTTTGQGFFSENRLGYQGGVEVLYWPGNSEPATITATEQLTGRGHKRTALVTAIPNPPSNLALAPEDDLGISNTDRVTNIKTAITITGEGESGCTASLYDNGIEILGAVAPVKDRVFSVDIELGEGRHNITAKLTSAAGYTSLVHSETLQIEIDSTAPSAPPTLDLDSYYDSGASINDNITNMTHLLFQGQGNESGRIDFYDNGVFIPGASQMINAPFYVWLNLTEGSHAITTKLTDAAGNVSPASPVLNVTVDTTTPPAPAGLNLSSYDDSGMSNSDRITKTTTGITITGTGEDGTKIVVYDKGVLLQGVSATVSGGAFSIDLSLAEGLHELTVKQTDAAGLTSTVSQALAITVDTTAPSTSAGTGAGLYGAAQQVALTCQDGTGSGCHRTYYSTDGSEPTSASNWYSTAIPIAHSCTLKFYSVDKAGNAEQPVKAVSYLIDMEGPSVEIVAPQSNSTVSEIFVIEAKISDAVSSVSKVEIQITDGSWYVTGQPGSEYLGYAEAWLSAQKTGADTWSYFSSGVPWQSGKTYTIKVRATDEVGHVSLVSSTVTYLQAGAAWTTLSLDLSSQTILQNETIDAAGKLTRLPGGVAMNDLPIKLTITPPPESGQSQRVETTTTYDDYGHFKYENLGGFTHKGPYTLKASFDGTATLGSSASSVKTVLVGSQAGYAIIVQGKIPNSEGLLSHNKTANRIYTKLKERGFLDDNITYYNYDKTQTGVDEIPTKGRVKWAVETWAYNRMSGSPAPLYVIMVDHGNRNAFYLNNEVISPQDLNSWLDTLEGKLGSAWIENRIVIIGACFSGSFVPVVSKRGRVIVTSSSEDEESYKGPQEPDGVRSGEFFLEEFFQSLWRGRSLREAFVEATRQTEIFTRSGAVSANAALPPYFDDAVQHPILDDNGDAFGSNILSESQGDGIMADKIYLGTGVTYDSNSQDNPAEVLEVTGTLYLGGAASSALLWARTNGQESIAWMEIRPPSKELSSAGTTGQLELDIEKQLMVFSPSASPPRWEKNYENFASSGMYEIFYFARDTVTEQVSPMKRSRVYKAKAGNQAPSAFGLLSPQNGAEVKTVLLLDWEDSSDVDGRVTYNLVVATDSTFSNVVYTKEDIAQSMTYIDEATGLADQTLYYWKVLAVDPYGARTRCRNVWSFKTNNTNVFPGFLKGAVYDALKNIPMDGATVHVNVGDVETLSFGGGFFLMSLPAATVDVSGTYTGYRETIMSGVKITEGNVTEINLLMIPEGSAVDRAEPLTRVAPAAGTYFGPQTVTLTCQDTGGSGCAATYYTTDGSEPNSGSKTYHDPITLTGTTTLKFYSRDFAGNIESARSAKYTVNPAKGNVNADGVVDLADAILAVKVLAGAEVNSASVHPEIADVNGDGQIGMADVIYILQKAAGLR
jgi:hypothetical protein